MNSILKMKQESQSFRRPTLEKGMITNYADWSTAAREDDNKSNAANWKKDERSHRYDHQFVRRRLDMLYAALETGDPKILMYHLSEGVHGNIGGIGSPSLYSKAKFGTKDLVSTYISEISKAIDSVVTTDSLVIPLQQKRDFLHRTKACYGSTALMLSGAGSLGPFHLGVAKALMEQGLLPNVISGSSAGALVTAILGTHDEDSLPAKFNPRIIANSFSRLCDGSQAGSNDARRKPLQIEELREFVESQIPDLTFGEALELTGYQINITISPSEIQQRSRMLNAITTPHVFIREAVLASCAIPGIFPAVSLMAKNVKGEREPFMPYRKWVDGSISDDLPSKRLARLYGVNHFIASQTNPIVLWAIRDPDYKDGVMGKLWDFNQSIIRQWFKATYPMAMNFVKNVHPLNLVTRMIYSIVTQEYTADINIIPRQRFIDPRKLLSALSEEEIELLIKDGEAAAWPKIEQIRNSMLIGQIIDKHLAEMELGYM